jgi:5-methylcytosine-specific restriction protein A
MYPCKQVGCIGEVETRGTYCKVHSHHKARDEKRKLESKERWLAAISNTKADPVTQAMYQSKEWRVLKRKVLAENPFCACCGEPAFVVDHIVPWQDGGVHLFLLRENLQSLCKSCHSRKTTMDTRKRQTNRNRSIGGIRW